MAILVSPSSRIEEWAAELRAQMPNEDLRVWPEVGDPAEIEYLIAWRMSRADLATLPNLQCILCQGAGTEQWQKPGIDVPVVRLADPEMANEMAGYAVAWVLRHQRRFSELESAQHRGEWKVLEHTQPYKYRVGVLGYGEIGSRISRAFGDLGYVVNAWTRSGRDEERVTHYAGHDELEDFLGNSDAVINVLPSTDATAGLLTSERLAQFVPGSIFVNVGRGTVLADEGDLIEALNNGPIAAAVLDVTEPEPPADDSPLWTHPAVTLTPHISGMTQVGSAATLIAANIARLRAGQEPFPLLDRSLGY